MQQLLEQLKASFGGYLPNLLAALGILVVGWLVALAISALARAALNRTTLDNKIAAWISGGVKEDSKKDGEIKVEAIVGRVVFWVLMIFVVIAFFQVLGLAFVAGPLQGFLDRIFEFLPSLLSAAALALVAWLLAKGLRFAVQRAASAAKLDERLATHVEDEEGPPVALSKTLGETVYWLVFLLFVPLILGALKLEGLLEPVNALVQKIFAFLPNLLGAAVVFVAGWFLARILQRILTNLLAAGGLDRVGDSVGLNKVIGDRKLSGLVGLVVYILILIPVIISALNYLKIEAITRPASAMLNSVFAALPRLFGAVLVVGIAYVVGKLLSGLIANLLAGVGFDKFIERLGLVRVEKKIKGDDARRKPSDIVGYLVLVALLLFATVEALNLLEFANLALMVNDFIFFAADVLLGLVIFGFGYYLANLAAKTVAASGVEGAQLLSTVTRVAILVLVSAMALRQMGVAEDIILLAFGLVLGAIAVAAAIAFGVGGRGHAARQLDRWTSKAGGDG